MRQEGGTSLPQRGRGHPSFAKTGPGGRLVSSTLINKSREQKVDVLVAMPRWSEAEN